MKRVSDEELKSIDTIYWFETDEQLFSITTELLESRELLREAVPLISALNKYLTIYQESPKATKDSEDWLSRYSALLADGQSGEEGE